MNLSDRLRQTIKTSGKSATCIAKDTHVTVPSITEFLRQRRSLSLATAEKLARYFGLELTEKKGRCSHG